ncbi:unnamed protein product [Amoebophrya sp. A25]|nr:unnamed protein product [Amoebophrya sp. A25]|eukprot:GSA25T00015646001.1
MLSASTGSSSRATRSSASSSCRARPSGAVQEVQGAFERFSNLLATSSGTSEDDRFLDFLHDVDDNIDYMPTTGRLIAVRLRKSSATATNNSDTTNTSSCQVENRTSAENGGSPEGASVVGDVCSWHPNMLKHGNYVVDESHPESSWLARWNAANRSAARKKKSGEKIDVVHADAVAALELDYADRLLLVNGRPKFTAASKLFAIGTAPGSTSYRATARLVFWRPGEHESSSLVSTGHQLQLPVLTSEVSTCSWPRQLPSSDEAGSDSAPSLASLLPSVVDVDRLFSRSWCASCEQRAGLCAALLRSIMSTTSVSFRDASKVLKKELERLDLLWVLKEVGPDWKTEIERLACSSSTKKGTEVEARASAITTTKVLTKETLELDGDENRACDTKTTNEDPSDRSTVPPESPVSTTTDVDDQTTTMKTESAAAEQKEGETSKTCSGDASNSTPPATSNVDTSSCPNPLSPPEVRVSEKLPALYRCRRCRQPLFTAAHIQRHEVDPEAAARGRSCTPSFFVEPLGWMAPIVHAGEQAGKLVCPNDRCKAKLGSFSWMGLKCGCGHWHSPAFQIHCDKFDEVLRS